MKPKYNPFLTRLALAGISISLGASAKADMFDLNADTAGFGVADATTYDWFATNGWAPQATSNDTGTGTGHATWASSATRQAFFVGLASGTNYTVRLGATGATGTTLQNFGININQATTGALAGAVGNVTIGNPGDTGVLTVGNANSVGAQGGGTLTVNNPISLNGGTARQMNFRGGNVVINGVVSGTGASNISSGSGTFGLSSGTLTLAGNNSFAGSVTAASGYVFSLQHANALGATGGTNSVSSGGTMEVANGVTIGTGESITINGDGVSSIGALRGGTGNGTWAGGVTLGAASRIGATAGNTLTVTGGIGGGFALGISGQSGTGIVILNPTGTNGYTGATNIIRGILRLGKSDALPTGTTLDVDSATSVTDAATFDLASFSQTVAALQDSATTGNINGVITNSVAATISTLTVNQASNTTYDGIIQNGSGTVVLTKRGVGNLTLNGANTFSGGTNIENGKIIIGGGDNRLATGGAVNIGSVSNTGVLILGDGTNARSQTVAGLTSSGLGGAVVGNAAANSALTISFASGTSTFGGTLGGAAANENNLSLTKAGAGTQVLSGNNTYVGATTVTSGILRISHDNALGSTAAGTSFGGGTNTGRVELTGGITTGEGFSLGGRSNSNVHISNLSGNNTISGNLGNATGGNIYTIESQADLLTLSGGLTNGGGTTGDRFWQFTGAGNGLVSGVMSNGTAILVVNKLGTGTWTLSNANTYTGNTKVTAGTLALTNNLAIQNSAFDTSGAGTLDVTAVNTPTFGGLIGDATTGQNLVLPSNVTSLTLNLSAGVTQTYVKNISGGAAGLTLTKTGTSTQVLGGTNSYTGLTTVSGGELQITNAGAIGGTNVTVSSGAQLTLDGGITVSGKTLSTSGSGRASGTGSFIGGLQSISGTNEWAGNVILGADNSRIGARAGATLVVSGAIDDGANTYTAVIRNATVATNGAGNATTITEISGANTYGGNTQLISGLTRLGGGDNRLPTGTILQFGGSGANAKFDMNGRNQELAGLAVMNNVSDPNRDWNANELTNSSATPSTLTVNTATDQTFGLTTASFTGSSNYTGNITGNIALEKSGSAKLTLSGTNTYSGATLVSAGTLFVTGSLTSNVTVSDTATVGGGGTVGDISFGGGSFLDIALAVDVVPDSLTTGAISFAAAGFGVDNLVFNGAAVDWSTVANGTYTLLTGTLNSLNLDNFGLVNAYDLGGGRSAYFQSGSLQLVVIPEPNVAALLGTLGALILMRRRRSA